MITRITAASYRRFAPCVYGRVVGAVAGQLAVRAARGAAGVQFGGAQQAVAGTRPVARPATDNIRGDQS